MIIYNKLVLVFVGMVLLSSCTITTLYNPNKLSPSISPHSVSINRDELYISDSSVDKFTQVSGIKMPLVKKLGVLPIRYSEEEINSIVEQKLRIDFEEEYMDFYNLAIRRYFEGYQDNESEFLIRVLQVFNKKLFVKTSEFLRAYAKQSEIEDFERAVNLFEQSIGKRDIAKAKELLYQIQEVKELVSNISTTKRNFKDWLQFRTGNYSFSKSLQITLEVSGNSIQPILIPKLAYARVYNMKPEKFYDSAISRFFGAIFGRGAEDISEQFSLTEVDRDCDSNPGSCRIQYMHTIDQNSPNELLDFYEKLSAINDPENLAQRAVINNYGFDVTALIYGEEYVFSLPGQFFEVKGLEE